MDEEPRGLPYLAAGVLELGEERQRERCRSAIPCGHHELGVGLDLGSELVARGVPQAVGAGGEARQADSRGTRSVGDRPRFDLGAVGPLAQYRGRLINRVGEAAPHSRLHVSRSPQGREFGRVGLPQRQQAEPAVARPCDARQVGAVQRDLTRLTGHRQGESEVESRLDRGEAEPERALGVARLATLVGDARLDAIAIGHRPVVGQSRVGLGGEIDRETAVG